MIYGPITSESITKNGSFSSDIIKGDALILELFEPAEEKGNSVLNLSRIVHGFRNIFQPTNFGDSNSSCQDDVSCNSNWSIQSNGVAMIILSNMERLCSGSLLNNACQDFTPNILTAFHCIDIGNDINNINACSNNEVGNGTLTAQEITNAEDWVFRFQYKRPNCNTGSEPSSFYTFQRATFRAGWFNTDFALVEMNVNPINGDPNSGIRYLGWTRAGVAPTSGAFLGHPKGDVMKISPFGAAANNTAQITFTLCQNPLRQSISPVNTHWTTSINDGALEGGSSGGPFFDQNNRVVGQVHGGVIGCAPRIVHAGRFDVSWTGGGAANNRLSTWLTNDPNVTQTNTISMPYISGSSAVCSSGTTFTVNYVPPGGTVRWACSTNISFDNQPGNPKVFTANGTNSGWIVARIITSCNDTITLPTQVVWVGPYSSSNYPITGPSSASCRQYVYYSIPTLIGVTSINWIWPSGWTYISGQGTTNLALQTGTTGSSGTVAVQATNACGSGSYATKYTSVTGICGYSLTVSPNPATNEATIELINTVEEKATETPEWELEVFSPGQLLKTKTGKLKDKIHKLNTQGWKDGVYIVRAIINGEPLTEKLVIKQ